ncbi:DUF3558 domain-containing protein [Amycolatopsis sp. Poz14]|uniref:DUF3558 domain-containing protein n=1 Tax=Amycolatopsis sp. Poz14 TaxID=1447705 RepID=UPI001EE89719|nr:DUF3558 domain-containing protein [Amycolatopsis sp. Poz14]MCG3756678.1 DUF3558 domain-containing protein [Amycolatopsis sp. Poz14]
MKSRIFLTAAAAGLLLAACSTPTGGVPSPATSAPGSTSAGSLPYAGAPKVEHPLPDSIISGSPCDALTPEQVKADVGHAADGEPETLPIGSSCTWSNTAGASLGVFFTNKRHEGLSPYYAQTRKQMKRFDVLPPVQGYPAVAYSDKPGSVSPFCQVAVGIADTADFVVSVSVGNGSTADACPISTQIAGQVLTNLKQKAGR